ncbi:MAG: hypothetical protein LBO66_03150 [Deltaproteobacteria bacterium]|nr:hypothetical protein [Deltaproteobacteria bacterium]
MALSKPRRAPVTVTVIYAACARGRPWDCYPSEKLTDGQSLFFKIDQIYLEDRIDMAKLVQGLNAEIAGREPGAGKFTLSERERAEFFLAPLGKIPREPAALFEEYLDLAAKLAKMTSGLEDTRHSAARRPGAGLRPLSGSERKIRKGAS